MRPHTHTFEGNQESIMRGIKSFNRKINHLVAIGLFVYILFFLSIKGTVYLATELLKDIGNNKHVV